MERSLSGSRFSSIGWRCGSGSGSSTGAEGPPSSTSCGPPTSAYRRPRPSPPQPRPRNRPAPYTPLARRGVNALSSSVQSVVCYSVRVKLLTSALDTGPDVRVGASVWSELAAPWVGPCSELRNIYAGRDAPVYRVPVR